MKEIKDLENKLKRITASSINKRITSEQQFYDTNISVAKDVITALCSTEKRTNHIILASSMQAGKTAVMNAICNILNISSIGAEMGIKKYIFATGMNDVKLKAQTTERGYSQIIGANEENVWSSVDDDIKGKKFFYLKNSDLKKCDLQIKNSILFLDEVQYGTNEKNVLTKFLEKNNVDWKNRQTLARNNTYIVSVSATPFNEMVSDTLDVKKTVNIKLGENYIGVTQFIQNNMIEEATPNDFMNGSIIHYVKEAYDRIMANTRGCGIIYIRTIDYFDGMMQYPFFRDNFNIIPLYAKSSNIDYTPLNDNIDKMIAAYDYLESKTNNKTKLKPIMVLIKGAFRAGVTIPTRHKDFTYMVYDYSRNPEVTAQALLGRMCGYRDITKDDWKRTVFYVNKSMAEQYSDWERDYSIKENIPSERREFKFVDKDYKGGFTEIASKCCGNVEIGLTDEEILEFYSKSQKRSTNSLCNEVEPILCKLIKDRCLEDEIFFDYLAEAYLLGKNNYARSTQEKRFEAFTKESKVYTFRAEKIKRFAERHDGRNYATKDDVGERAVSIVLDANIIKDENGNITISGNKRLLVYQVELALRTKVANRKNMFKPHKCTDLKYQPSEAN